MSIVLDAKKQAARCEVCGKLYPWDNVLPSSIQEFINWVEYIRKSHRKCKNNPVSGKEKGGGKDA